MSFFGSPDDGFVPGSRGPRTGFLDNIQIGYDQQYEVDSQLSIADAFQQEHNRNVEELERITGVKQKRITLQEAAVFLQIRDGDIAPPVATSPTFSFQITSRERFLREQEAFRQAAREAAINNDALFVQNGLKSNDDILQEIFALQKKVEERSAEAAATRGYAGFLGNIVGAVAGSFSQRDPLLLASLPVGGAGRTVATRLATEAVAAGTVEAALQYGPVAKNRRIAGLREYTEEERLLNILTVAGGAAAIRGALFELPAAGISRLRDQATPDIRLDFEDAQLRQMLNQLPNTPAKRAASDLLDEDAITRQLSPYGDGYEGLRRFTEETAEVELALLGRTDTAIGRLLPSDVSFTMRQQSDDFVIVRERAPEVAARFDAAKARIDELDSQITEVDSAIEARTLIDAVRLVDEQAADELAALSARDLRRAEGVIESGATFNRVEAILNRIGKDRILKAAEDWEIGPKKQLQRLRQQRKAANKEYRAALRAMEEKRVQFNRLAQVLKSENAAEVKDLLGYAIATKPMRGSALSRELVSAQRELILNNAENVADEVGQAVAASSRAAVVGQRLAEGESITAGIAAFGGSITDGLYDALLEKIGKLTLAAARTEDPIIQAGVWLRERGMTVDHELLQKANIVIEAAKDAPDFAIAMRQGLEALVNAPDRTLQIGDAAIPAGFRILNEAGEEVEISAIMRDLEEDERLVQAMGSCAI